MVVDLRKSEFYYILADEKFIISYFFSGLWASKRIVHLNENEMIPF